MPVGQQRNMLPLGWIRKNGDNRSRWVVELNPKDKDSAFRWSLKEPPDGDLLVVISED